VKKLLCLLLLLLAAAPASAQSYDWSVVAKVVAIEVTYMPTSLPFKLDTAAGTCPAGSVMNWTMVGADATAKAQNAQAVLAALMTAQSAGRSVTVFGNNSGCKALYLYIN
jgi:hypothetical protein